MNPARIAELTVVEFKNLVREAVTESFADLLGDPDEGARSAGRICRGAEAVLWRQSARAEKRRVCPRLRPDSNRPNEPPLDQHSGNVSLCRLSHTRHTNRHLRFSNTITP